MKIKEVITEFTSAGGMGTSVATGPYGNGFLNGGPGTITRAKSPIKPKRKSKKKSK